MLPQDTIQVVNSKKASNLQDGIDYLESCLNDLSDVWAENIKNYIESCISSMALSEIEVSSEERARAIDIYENLNRGGISLSTFDLVMARVAIVSKENYRERIINNILLSKVYDVNLMPFTIGNIFRSQYPNGEYNASKNTKCFSDVGINQTYVDAFLNVMSLYCNNKAYNPKSYNSDMIKRNRILQLPPTELDDNCEKICTAIDRAMFFFQSRCGIRSIKEINNTLMIVLVGTIFTNDAYYDDKKVHDRLEALYWASIFSGEFDKDQNSALIRNLKNFISMIQGTGQLTWINDMKKEVLDAKNYSDKELLLFEKVAVDRYPKKMLRNYISQYFLSRTYTDMFDSSVLISVFSDVASTLELHHIIPLGSVNKVNQSTNKLRTDKSHVCNSPLNFAYITSTSNRAISNKSLDDYAKDITVTSKAALYINSYTDASCVSDNQKIKAVLTNRYNDIKGIIQTNIMHLLM